MSEQILGPFTIDLKVHITGEDGTVHGAATVGLAPGQVPTLEAIHRALGQTLAAIPDDYRLQSADEFFGSLVQEKTGRRMKFATPANFDYDLAAVEAAARAAFVPTEEKLASDSGHDDDPEDFEDEWEDEE